jgi:hypothetical protein
MTRRIMIGCLNNSSIFSRTSALGRSTLFRATLLGETPRTIPWCQPGRWMTMDNESLIAAIPGSTLADTCSVAVEAGRRRLAAAVPALAALCRRFAGFGSRRQVPEQAAALEALAMIGGRDAGRAVSEMIERAVVQGPTLQIAVCAAARLGATLSSDALQQLLRDPEPSIRADACRCARALPELILILIDLLHDLDRRVATAATLALGRMGKIEARPILKGLLLGCSYGRDHRRSVINRR